jgi:glycosyltransferase involved in cell wall biosynthesis
MSGEGWNGSIRALVVAVTLRGGGAERQIVHLLNGLNRDQFEPHLYLFKEEGIYLEDLPEDLPLISPRVEHKVELPRVLVHLRRTILSLKPDVAFSNMWPETASLISVCRSLPARKRPKVIVGIQNNPRFYGLWRVRTVQWLRSDIDRLVACSPGVREALVSLHPSFRRARVIPNAVDLYSIREQARKTVEHPWVDDSVPILVAMGRLVEQKGFHHLLPAIQLLRRRLAVRLWILGKGPLKPELEYQARELGISDAVQFLGFQSNPFKYIARSDVFVLSSLWEGLPSVLVEAMGLGLPVVATRAPYGPEDVIEDGVNGYLVPVANPEALATSIEYVLSNPRERDRVGNAGRSWVEQKFSASHVSRQFEDLFREVLADRVQR